MSAIDEAVECACGLEMIAPHIGKPYKLCVNCDTVQDIEIGDKAKRRVETVRDRIFKTVWRERVKIMFPEAGKAAA